MKQRMFKGYLIIRSGISGMYYTESCRIGYLRADTLAGLKAMITDEINHHSQRG